MLVTIFQEIDALSFEDREIVQQVMAEAVPLMTERQRDCLRLYLDGMTQAEVGAKLGIEQQVAQEHIALALGRIRQVSAQHLYLPANSAIMV